MALVTENLGFGVTAGTAYEHPYPFARRMSTLDHLTNGRVGWNVVTGYLPSAARNMGNEDQLEHDDRYDHADEYLEVLYKLWEGSWEDDAVIRDRESGVFTDPRKVHEIGHKGKHFSVPGIHLSEPSTQRTPVIYQAGASSRGIAFAAGNAEAIFVAAPTMAVLKGATVTPRRSTLCSRSSRMRRRRKPRRNTRSTSRMRARRARLSSCPAGWASTCRSTTSMSRSAT
jgi:FMN-dependent oxidoreductase (nitrilotriacetate monooxygenase family)